MKRSFSKLAFILLLLPFLSSCRTISDDFKILDMHLQGFPFTSLQPYMVLRYFEGKPVSELIAITGTPKNTVKKDGQTTYSWSNLYVGEEDETYTEIEWVPNANGIGQTANYVTKTRTTDVTKICFLRVTFNSENVITKTEGDEDAKDNNCGDVGRALGSYGDKNRKIILAELTQRIRMKRGNTGR
ncbi:hypothetical protein [Bartonella sp. HY038]|uniref:hypothetical protein n=1 Tax=Bartonella sp. HY038 TaxID=2759660 RepID=UPI0015FE7B18|nr:hypothetical protein [Bartonella sp. HY038]